MSRADADRMVAEVLKVNPSLSGEQITPVSVKLLQALRNIAADKTPGTPIASSFTRPTKSSSSSTSAKPAAR
jgi:hypothetical protein